MRNDEKGVALLWQALIVTGMCSLGTTLGYADKVMPLTLSVLKAVERPDKEAVADEEAVILAPRLELPESANGEHPLASIARKMWAGEFGEQPSWRLPLLIEGLREKPRVAKLTAFSSRCPDGGGPRTRWGTRVRRGICAADPRYWGPGSVVWIGPPVQRVLIVEDTGSAIKGRDRFDVCFGADAAACRRFGVRRAVYVPLSIAPTTRRWGTKPRNWHPPFVPLEQALVSRN